MYSRETKTQTINTIRHTNTQSQTPQNNKRNTETYQPMLGHTGKVRDKQHTQKTQSQISKHTVRHTKTGTETCKHMLNHASTVRERQKHIKHSHTYKHIEPDTQTRTHTLSDTGTVGEKKTNTKTQRQPHKQKESYTHTQKRQTQRHAIRRSVTQARWWRDKKQQ